MKLCATFAVMFFFGFAVLDALAAGSEDIPDLSATWETPTTREDGTPLNAEDIQGYRLYHSVDGGAVSIVNLPAGTNSHTFVDVVYGTHTLAISTVAEEEGQKSESIIKTIEAIIKPSAPAFTRLILERCDNAGQCTQETLFSGVQ